MKLKLKTKKEYKITTYQTCNYCGEFSKLETISEYDEHDEYIDIGPDKCNRCKLISELISKDINFTDWLDDVITQKLHKISLKLI